MTRLQANGPSGLLVTMAAATLVACGGGGESASSSAAQSIALSAQRAAAEKAAVAELHQGLEEARGEPRDVCSTAAADAGMQANGELIKAMLKKQ